MKSVLFFATAALAATGTVQKRQASVIQSAIAQVSASVAALNSDITGFSTAADVARVQGASDAVVSAVNTGNAAVSPLAVLAANDAVVLAQPITDLADLIDTVVNNIISRKSDFVGLNVGGLVYTAIQQQQTSANSFAATILTKIPQSLQSIGQGLADRITASLARANAAYADQANAGTSAAPTSSASAAPTSSGAAATTSAGAYTTSGAAATTTSHAASTTAPAATTSHSISVYPGAAATAGAHYGAAAMAALAVAAML